MGNSNSKKISALEDPSPYCSRVVPVHLCCGKPHTHKAKSCSSCHKWYCGESKSKECSRCNKPATDTNQCNANMPFSNPSLNPKSSVEQVLGLLVTQSSFLAAPDTNLHATTKGVTSKELRGEPKA